MKTTIFALFMSGILLWSCSNDASDTEDQIVTTPTNDEPVIAMTAIPDIEFERNLIELGFDDEEDKHVVLLLGYEGDRFSDAVESLQLKSDQITLIFGVQSYKLNWERNSIHGNLKVIVDNELNDRFVYCGANNPVAVSREIKRLIELHLRLKDPSTFWLSWEYVF